MKIIDVTQNTPEWFKCRAGIPSASNFDKIITTEGKPSKQRQKYMYQLAGERVSGTTEEGYQNLNMIRGQEMENEARQLYSLQKGVEVRQVGFCITDDDKYGCSPDGLVGEDGGLEIKNPTMAVHVGYLIDNKLPLDYFQQVQGSLLVTGRPWWDFMSYYPSIRPLIIRVFPDEKFLRLLRIELELFAQELNDLTNRIR